MAVVEAMHQDGVPLNHAAVGYVFFATRREGSPRAVELALGLFLSLEPHLRSKQVSATHSVFSISQLIWSIASRAVSEALDPVLGGERRGCGERALGA